MALRGHYSIITNSVDITKTTFAMVKVVVLVYILLRRAIGLNIALGTAASKDLCYYIYILNFCLSTY